MEFKHLSHKDRFKLEETFSCHEISKIVRSNDGNKSSGPDGFNFGFLKTYWKIVKDDIVKFVNEFHYNAVVPKAITQIVPNISPKVRQFARVE